VSYSGTSSLEDLTRGGQLLLHFLRMLGQVVRKFGGALIILALLLTAGIFYLKTENYERYLGVRCGLAWVDAKLLGMSHTPISIRRPDESVVQSTPAAVLASAAVRETLEDLKVSAEVSALDALLLVAILACGIAVWIYRSGLTQRLEQHVRGSEVVEAASLRRLLRRRRLASDLHVAGVPLLQGSETSHLLITGSPGTGKSTSIYELLSRVRARGERCICFSPSGDFIQWFFREKTDRILNPFDQRCPSWDLWAECREPYHHELLAAAVVPDPARASDPFWNTAARAVIASLIHSIGTRNEGSIARMLELLTQVDLESLYEYMRGTEGAALVDPAGERTAVSIRTNAATYARAFKYLPIDRDPFHIRDWVRDEKGSGWVFLNAQREQLDAVRPVMSAWLEIFTNALTSLPPSRSRRIWLVIDELHSLNRIPSLEPFLAEGRKYGGCGVIAFHQVAQLRERYGKDGAEALTGACATWVCLRQNDPETAKWIAESFGQVEVSETHQGLTYGANEVRDGVSLSKVRKVRPLLLDSEISKLDNLEGYIRLPGRLPVAHFKQKWKPTPSVAPAFMPVPALVPAATEALGGWFEPPPTLVETNRTENAVPAGLFDEPAATASLREHQPVAVE
jgi:type IV conjugative transfer system coupling protein TraD